MARLHILSVVAVVFAYSPNGFAEVVNCNPVFTKAYMACKKVQDEINQVCQKMSPKTDDPASSDFSESKRINETSKACTAKTVDYAACEEAGETAIAQCLAAKAQAEADAKKAEEERVAAQKKIEDGQRKVRDGDVKQAEADLKGQSSVEGAQLRREGEKAQQEGAQERSQANNEMVAKDQLAQQNQDMANTLAALMDSIRRDTEQVQKAADTAGKNSDSILKSTGYKPEYADQTQRAVKPTNQNGSPTANPGQSGNPNNPQANGQQSKNDQSGGGGMPSLGGLGGSGSSSSSPLKVSDPPQDCSNPSVAASNPVCACRLNPTDSRCNSILAADKERREGVAKKQQVLSGETEGGGGGFSTKGGGYSDAPAAKNISQHGQLEQNSGGSAGKGVGSGMGQGASGASAQNAQGKASMIRDQTQSRSYGGGGGGGGSASFGGGGANSRIPTTFGSGVAGGAGKKVGAVSNSNGKRSAAEMRAHMQAQFNMRRNPAGVVGPDGITGKHTDQFKKIRTRYSEILGQ